MNIEIVGLPGVGKTTILREFFELHPEFKKFYSTPIINTYSEYWSELKYYISHPTVLLVALFQGDYQFFILKLRRIARRKSYFGNKKNSILFDRGIVQPLLEASIMTHRFRGTLNWDKLLKEIICDHFYVIITDTMENIVQREMTRKPRHFTYDIEKLQIQYKESMAIVRLLKGNALHLEINMQSFKDRVEIFEVLNITFKAKLYGEK
jgi:hypothetical protein